MFLFDSASRSYSKKKIILTVNLPKNQGQHILNPEFSLFLLEFCFSTGKFHYPDFST